MATTRTTTRAGTKQPVVLDRRALNRALLARQHLLTRTTARPLAVIEHLVGMQAQVPHSPYVGLWSRVHGFEAAQLSTLLLQRRAVRIALLRSTIHLVSAADCLALRPVVEPVLERGLQTGSPFGKRLRGVNQKALVRAARGALSHGPMTTTALGKLLHERFPAHDAEAIGHGIRAWVPLVQIPPRGVWGEGGQPVCADAEDWLAAPLVDDDAPDAMLLRYLRAYGPASVHDAQMWSGLQRLGDVFARLRPKLRVFHDEDGRELFDLPRAPRPVAGAPAPTRFLPEFDQALLAHADRRRIIDDESRAHLSRVQGVSPGAMLVDGFVRGTWKVARTKQTATLRIALHAPLRKGERDDVLAEGARLLAFVAADAARRDVVVGKP